jgi:transposase-like protein
MRPACPFCDARDVERIGQWGGQMITSQWRCLACGSYFEALREELEDDQYSSWRRIQNSVDSPSLRPFGARSSSA